MKKWFLDVSRYFTGLILVLGLSGCGSFIAYYDVTGAQSTKCTIQGTSVICSEGNLSFTMTLGAEEFENHFLIYWDDSTWEATLKEGNKFEAFRFHEIQDSKEACHTIQSEILELEITPDRVKGTWQRESRTEGPKVCGDTPTGEKDEITLSGMRVQSL